MTYASEEQSPAWEDPKKVVAEISEQLFYMLANLESRHAQGESLVDDVPALTKRIKDYAADLHLAASLLR